MKKLSELRLQPGDTLFIDRIEGEVATLLLGREGDREENVPRRDLPADVEEGLRLRVTERGGLEIDRDATEAGRRATADLMAELLGDTSTHDEIAKTDEAPSTRTNRETPDETRP